MDFFGAQDAARRKTKILVALFCLAILLIVLSIYVLFSLIFNQGAGIGWDPEMFVVVALVTLAIIGGAASFKVMGLRAGGPAVARSLGGREVPLDTSDPDERRLLNVVEEMSIASGVPMPAVFILEEEGINAFAAGFSTHDAAVAVTQGALRQLSRDELQGVMAHEFSHILNGDMRLNIRLIGPLFGLLVITFIGRAIIRGSFYRGAVRRRGKNEGGLVFLGIALMIIGYIGVLFGRLIQAAISRQREFLADSAAVQFTRNPDGIAGALMRIGHSGTGSRIKHEHAEDTAHLFFARALQDGFATHPPLKKRIQTIKPDWDGQFLPPRKVKVEEPEQVSRSEKGGAAPSMGKVTGAALMTMAGQLTAANIRRAIAERTEIHAGAGSYLAKPEKARELLFALILADEPDTRADQLKFLPALAVQESEVLAAWQIVAGWTPSRRVETIMLLLAALKKLPAAELRAVPANLRKLAMGNGRLSLREAMVIALVSREIEGARRPSALGALSDDAGKFSPVISGLLAFFAALREREPAESKAAVRKAVERQELLAGKVVDDQSALAVEDLEKSLSDLLSSSFALRKAILTAAAEIVVDDGEVSAEEWRALRLVASTLDCPMPPVAE